MGKQSIYVARFTDSLNISPFSGHQSHCVAFYLKNDILWLFVHKCAGGRILSGIKSACYLYIAIVKEIYGYYL